MAGQATAAVASGTDRNSAIAKKKVVTPEARISFPSVFKAKAFNNQEPKFSATFLFPKTTDLKDLKRAALAAGEEKWGPKEKWPKNIRLPFRNGDEKAEMEGYAGCIFISASSKTQPGLVDNNLVPILSERDFYPGCYGRAELIAFAYDTAGNKGISFSLQNIQKLRDGKSFSGRKDARDVFDVVEDVTPSESEEGLGDDSDDLGGF